MKNSEIHKGLPECEIRDFFASMLAGIFDKECENKKHTIPYDGKNPFEWSIKDDEAQIEMLRTKIKLTQQKMALITLMKERDWKEHDVSDDTERDLPYRLHLSFIGTDEEHEKLLDLINHI